LVNRTTITKMASNNLWLRPTCDKVHAPKMPWP
jgi:hypothetical protein